MLPLYSPLSHNNHYNAGTSAPKPAPKKALRRDRVSSDIALSLVDTEDSQDTPSIPMSSSMTDSMYGGLQRVSSMDNMPISEWAPVGNSYTISSGHVSNWNKKTEGEDAPQVEDKKKPMSLTKMFRRSKAIKLVVNI